MPPMLTPVRLLLGIATLYAMTKRRILKNLVATPGGILAVTAFDAYFASQESTTLFARK